MVPASTRVRQKKNKKQNRFLKKKKKGSDQFFCSMETHRHTQNFTIFVARLRLRRLYRPFYEASLPGFTGLLGLITCTSWLTPTGLLLVRLQVHWRERSDGRRDSDADRWSNQWHSSDSRRKEVKTKSKPVDKNGSAKTETPLESIKKGPITPNNRSECRLWKRTRLFYFGWPFFFVCGRRLDGGFAKKNNTQITKPSRNFKEW